MIINVLTVLATGVGLAGIIGMATKSFGIWQFLKAANDGILGMSEIIIIGFPKEKNFLGKLKKEQVLEN